MGSAPSKGSIVQTASWKGSIVQTASSKGSFVQTAPSKDSIVETAPSKDSDVKNVGPNLPWSLSIPENMTEEEQKRWTNETQSMLRTKASDAVAIKQK
ncbi:hypothetical protein DPMN_069460 [Dreissena polymorpha]|uniref:Uncharacterized protein n=1 Tax=Dreissena polymorpha TaxID=45954 RepID=A0A9D3Z4E1_DREPO|nr:hypothetical protein DPMN_069460 [Dreissena polymorpha]